MKLNPHICANASLKETSERPQDSQYLCIAWIKFVPDGLREKIKGHCSIITGWILLNGEISQIVPN